jgi:hypothetical protein
VPSPATHIVPSSFSTAPVSQPWELGEESVTTVLGHIELELTGQGGSFASPQRMHTLSPAPAFPDAFGGGSSVTSPHSE